MKRLIGWLDDGTPLLDYLADDGLTDLDTIHFLPTSPGWYVLYWCDDDSVPDEARVWRSPVVAWRITEFSGTHNGEILRSTAVRAVSVEGIDWDETNYWLLGPDQQVSRTGIGPVPYEKWLEQRKQQLAEKQPEVDEHPVV
jgi:hypothetical protein